MISFRTTFLVDKMQFLVATKKISESGNVSIDFGMRKGTVCKTNYYGSQITSLFWNFLYKYVWLFIKKFEIVQERRHKLEGKS